MQKQKFIGSTIALVLGWLCLVRGLALVASQQLSQEMRSTEHAILVAGLIMILGSTAYRSAIRRKYGVKPDSTASIILEFLLLVICLLAVLLQRDLTDRIYNHPIFLVVVPIWVFIAYTIAFFKKSIKSEQPATDNKKPD
ncbi:MAG: hypothetical protein KAV87_17265 [Desulfobacteraceae bacterium]|nr:hypothetical protein [Desulfobacteraceae bacterium]